MSNIPQKTLRNIGGAIILQTALFFAAVIMLLSIANDLHKGWTIIDELNRLADESSSLISRGSFKTINEQLIAIEAKLLNAAKFATSKEQIKIEWLSAQGQVINNSESGDPEEELIQYLDGTFNFCMQSGTLRDCDLEESITEKIRVTVTFPRTHANAFPSGALRLFLTDTIDLNATSEAAMAREFLAQHFKLKVRTKSLENGLEYLPVCSGGDLASTKAFWNLMCEQAAKLSNLNEANSYTAANNFAGTLESDSSLINSWDLATDTFLFDRVGEFDCEGQIVNEVRCFPLKDKTFSAAANSNIRYLIINAADFNPAQIQVFASAAEAGCPNPNSCI